MGFIKINEKKKKLNYEDRSILLLIKCTKEGELNFYYFSSIFVVGLFLAAGEIQPFLAIGCFPSSIVKH